MKPTIGPYVAVRDLTNTGVSRSLPVSTVQTGTGQAGSVQTDTVQAGTHTVRTVRATDRLTGMPVLLHVLPRPVPLPQGPPPLLQGAPVLFPSDAGMDGEAAYLVTELPLAATPARDPLLAARGALAALAALHEAGMTHGGVNAAQLWSVDGEVLLAGAGLPWSDAPGTPQEDLSALAHTLEGLGGLPAPLRPLRDAPGTLGALDALKRLNGEAGEVERAQAGTPHPTAQPEATVEVAAQPQEQKAEEPSGVAGVPEALALARPVAAEAESAARPAEPAAAEIEWAAPAPLPPALDRSWVGGRLSKGAELDGDFESVRVIPRPVGVGAESPQERRRRENEARREQTIQDAEAGAKRREERLRAQLEAAQLGAGQAHPDVGERSTVTGSTFETGRLPSRKGAREPIRIGWDEDDNLRLLREPPKPASPERPAWLRPLLGVLLALLLLGLGVLGVRRLSGTRTVAPAVVAAPVPAATARTTTAVPLPVQFVVRGAGGAVYTGVAQQARVVVLRAPVGSGLAAGTPLGMVPGTLNFPVAGTYRVKVAANGYTPARFDLSVPRGKPVTISLGR